MIHQVQIPGFEGREIKVQTNAFSGHNTLIIDGQTAAPGPKRGQFLLKNADGREVMATLKAALPDTLPILVVDGQTIRLEPKLQWYELVWTCFPLVLIFLGGMIGGILGFIGAAINTQIFRSKMPIAVRYALAALITALCFMVWIVIVSLLQNARAR